LQLDQAMGKEIRWSRFLNDLSLNTPSKVWLTNITATEVVDTPAVATAETPGTPASYGTPNIGTLTFEGKGYTHNDVAAWLKSLGREEGLADPFFTKSTQEKIGTEDSVTFTSQAVITEDLLSGRFSDKAGS
jgi:Tfp pilus assembly protein PilN